MKTFLECVNEAAGIVKCKMINKEAFDEMMKYLSPILNKAAEIYAEQSNSHKPVVGGPGSDVRSEGEQLGNEAGEKSVREGKVINMQERERQELYKKILKRGE